MMRRFAGWILCLAALLSNGDVAYAEGTPSYRQVATVPLGGEGLWDYLTLDSTAHRLYVTRGTHVMVVDTNRNAVVGDIPNTPGVHGVAIAPRLGRGYTSNGRENTVTVFDLKSLKELQRISVGQNPDAILFDPVTERVFVFNGRSHDATVLEGASGKTVGTLDVGGKPEFAATDEKGTIYVNIEDRSEILAIDARTMKVKSHWPLMPGEEPTGLAIDRIGHHLFAVCGNKKMAVVDTQTGKVVAAPEIGQGPDATAFDPVLKIAFSSNGRDGTLTLVRADGKGGFTAVGNVPTRIGARTMALDPKSHRIYLITASLKKSADGGATGTAARRPAMEPSTTVLLVYGP